MSRILNFGSCNLDYVYSLDHIVAAGETEASDTLGIFPGGKGLNQSIAAARAGAEVYHAGCIGEDGMLLQSVLRGNGVDVSLLRISEGRSGHAMIQVAESGENSIVLYQGANVTFTREQIDVFLEGFGEGDILLVQNETNLVCYAVEKAYEKGMAVVLTPSPINGEIRKIDFSKLTYLILNEVEAKAISGTDDTDAALLYFGSRYPKLRVVMTLGKKGCIYRDTERSLFHPSFTVEAVDTTGAGDTFVGYFITAVSEGLEVEAALRIASAASALAVSQKGAATSVPRRREVEAALPALKPREENVGYDVLRQKILRYFELNLSSARLDGLASELGYSAVYTGATVKKLLGKTFSEILTERRCEAAAEMLRSTDMSVEQIISCVGYENESFFRSKFKKKYKKTPAEYRRLVKGRKIIN